MDAAGSKVEEECRQYGMLRHTVLGFFCVCGCGFFVWFLFLFCVCVGFFGFVMFWLVGFVLSENLKLFYNSLLWCNYFI